MNAQLQMLAPRPLKQSVINVPLRRGKTEFVSVADLWRSRIEALFSSPASSSCGHSTASSALPTPRKAALAVWAQYAPFRLRPMVVRYFDWAVQ